MTHHQVTVSIITMKLLIIVVSLCITTASSQKSNYVNVGMGSVPFDNQYRAVDPFLNRGVERTGAFGASSPMNSMAADGPAPDTVSVSDPMFGDQAYTPKANSPNPLDPVDPDQPVEDYIKAEERGNPMSNMAGGPASMVSPGASRQVGNMGNMAGRGGMGGLPGSANMVAPNAPRVGRMGNMSGRGANGRVESQRRSSNRRKSRNNRSRNVIYNGYNGGTRREKIRKPYGKRNKYGKKQRKGGY
ncbi:unnamed protein product [Mytilus coruscus]|uniref:Uncharacterized protein n=1 Tax=Mytilus coruscus TaxID=42192 RepID=A0A6J8BD29_MYTCO|nr:unnamed protein product [Mytilus coruscus]